GPLLYVRNKADERYRGLAAAAAAIKASPAAAINTSLAAAAAAINTSPSAAAAAINTSPAFPAAAIDIYAATSGIAGRQEGVSRYTAPASISTNAFLAASYAARVIEAAAIGLCRQALSITIAAALVPLASFKAAAAAAASASKATAASSAAEEEETAEGL
ncbi:hypothetical protein L249_3416, partial [Ophiocordyceps polyrhachis-furcata BCC 54312]